MLFYKSPGIRVWGCKASLPAVETPPPLACSTSRAASARISRFFQSLGLKVLHRCCVGFGHLMEGMAHEEEPKSETASLAQLFSLEGFRKLLKL